MVPLILARECDTLVEMYIMLTQFPSEKRKCVNSRKAAMEMDDDEFEDIEEEVSDKE